MAIADFVLQRTLSRREECPAVPERHAARTGRVRSTAEWLAYFRANAARCRPIPWEVGADVAAPQLAAIARSLQAWQLGETSDGRHLRAAAARHAARVGDPAL